ncbi:MAG TPA: HAMP domain-containing sensor histidine kinase, partial [Clostridia bacterium]|nr:HAMP domain-containing sensor histidine kinase [Clostridia bacterium]
FLVNTTAGVISLVTSVLMIAAALFITRWRYNQIGKLSGYLRRIAGGEYSLDVRDNTEGELSILKSEIYKVTVTLSEQAELLQKDKLFLVDSISDISHQLKTPLTSMSVMTDLLSDKNLPPDKRIEFTQNIRIQLERLEWLVSSLLKLSRIDAGTINFKKDKVNVEELIERSIRHLVIPMEIKEQTLKIEGGSDVYFIGDFNWISEALTNVVKNCMEHTPKGGEIGISFTGTSLYTMIAIKDDGPGISKKDLPHIFKRFYKGDNAHEDSIGIGLAMSKSILESQGATIEVASDKGKGTRFTIKFYKGIL